MSKILNLIFKATDQATPTVDKVSGGVDGLAEGLKGLIGPAALATAGLVALKKVYEFGEEGAGPVGAWTVELVFDDDVIATRRVSVTP